MILESFAFTSIGGRDENQDSVGKIEKNGFGIYVVADGLGGHSMGEAASELAVSAVLDGEAAADEEFLKEKIASANEAILAFQSKENCDAKSTVAALAVNAGKACWANTGDSRVYHFHDDEISFVTSDHSVAYKKYKAGEITRAQIASDEDQSSLLRALGDQRRWEPNVGTIEGIAEGDAFILCSDGFWEYVLDEEMEADYLKASSAREWAKLMLLRAIDRVKPGHDNLSVITVMVK